MAGELIPGMSGMSGLMSLLQQQMERQAEEEPQRRAAVDEKSTGFFGHFVILVRVHVEPLIEYLSDLLSHAAIRAQKWRLWNVLNNLKFLSTHNFMRLNS